MPEDSAAQNEIDHAVLLRLTSLMRAERQVISDQQSSIDDPKVRKDSPARSSWSWMSEKYEEQTGYPVPNLDPTSREGQMLQAGLDAMREVMDEAQTVINDTTRQEGGRKVGDLGGAISAAIYLK
jgi:hypothetical protein